MWQDSKTAWQRWQACLPRWVMRASRAAPRACPSSCCNPAVARVTTPMRCCPSIPFTSPLHCLYGNTHSLTAFQSDNQTYTGALQDSSFNQWLLIQLIWLQWFLTIHSPIHLLAQYCIHSQMSAFVQSFTPLYAAVVASDNHVSTVPGHILPGTVETCLRTAEV